MEKRIETAWLLAFYGPLLTPRQRELLALYCDEDLSLAEIAAQEDISRQGVYDAVHRAQRQLADYEARLGLQILQADVNPPRVCLHLNRSGHDTDESGKGTPPGQEEGDAS